MGEKSEVIVSSDYTSSGDGLLELTEERLKGLMRSEPITDVYFVEQTPFARGKFASVRKIRHLATGVEYAAKFIRKRRRAADTTRDIRHEVAVLALCGDSPRLVRLHEVYDARAEFVLVLELALGGELQHVLDCEERLCEGSARACMRQVLEGLSHLHARRLAHLDLKPQNVLLTRAWPHGELKLCDFGISRVIEPGVEVREILGTPDYVAPEVLSYEPISLATDIWSAGVLAYVLLSGYSPFAGACKQETFLNISKCALTFPADLFPDVSEKAFEFIRAALIVEPLERMTVQECLDHPWLRDESPLNGSSINGILLPALHTTPTSGKDYDCPLHQDKNNTFTNEEDLNGDTETNGNPLSLVPLKHPHQRETSPPFPDAPSTPKVSRKSHPDSPTSVLNLCKKFQADPPKFCTEKNYKDKCDGIILSPGKILDVCKTYEPLEQLKNGHAKENLPQNGKAKDYDEVRKAANNDVAYSECSQCEVQCCNLVSNHKHTPGPINHNHVERAILC